MNELAISQIQLATDQDILESQERGDTRVRRGDSSQGSQSLFFDPCIYQTHEYAAFPGGHRDGLQLSDAFEDCW